MQKGIRSQTLAYIKLTQYGSGLNLSSENMELLEKMQGMNFKTLLWVKEMKTKLDNHNYIM